MAGEIPNLADVIVATGAAGGGVDGQALSEALDGHQAGLPLADELLANRNGPGPDVSFKIQPGEDAGREVFARLMESGAGAETQIRQRLVTGENPFRAQRYDFLAHRSSPDPQKGRLLFEGGFNTAPHMQGRGVLRKWVVSVALSRLGEFDITETHGGVAVVEWASGVFVDPYEKTDSSRQADAADAEPGPAEPAPGRTDSEPEPARERIVLADTADAEPEQPLAASDIRISRMADNLTEGEVWSVRNGLNIAKGLFEAAAPAERRVAGNFESVKRAASTGDRPVTLAGIPARVEFSSERYITHVGTAGDPQRYSHFDERGSVVTITFNPGADKPEVLKLDLDAEDAVEKIAGLGRRTFIDAEHVDPRLATHQWIGIIREAAEALNAR